MNAYHLSDNARIAIHECRMNAVTESTQGWGLFPVLAGPLPILVYLGERPLGADDGYDFLGWARGLGFQAAPSLGEWPFTVVSIEPAPAGTPVAALAYVEGVVSLTIWGSMEDARISLPLAFGSPDGT